MKIERLNENYNTDLRVLTEANLNRVSKGHEEDGYVILSASREQYSTDENNKRTNQLKAYLRSKGYSYLQVYGGYKELGQDKASMEKSFIVYPYNIVKHTSVDFNTFVNDMKDVAGPPDEPNRNHFDQDSILVCEPGGKPHYVALKDGVDEFGFDSVDYNNTDNEYFTAIKKWSDSSLNRKNRDFKNGKPQRFTFECYIQNPPASMSIGHMRWASGDVNHIFNEELKSDLK